MAYVALIAATIALRLACDAAAVNASDQLGVFDTSGNGSAAQTEVASENPSSAPLITGRSVAVRSPRSGEGAEGAERRPREGVGAMGFVRR
jgi:hypothetical protein